MAKIIDPTQTGNYPVVLSDRLLGKETNEVFTGIRCTLHAPPHPPAALVAPSRERADPLVNAN